MAHNDNISLDDLLTKLKAVQSEDDLKQLLAEHPEAVQSEDDLKQLLAKHPELEEFVLTNNYLLTFINANSWDEKQRILQEQHARLRSDDVERIFNMLLKQYNNDSTVLQLLKSHRELLYQKRGQDGIQNNIHMKDHAKIGTQIGVVRGGIVKINHYFGDEKYTVSGLPNPYLGLQSYTYDDREKYAGREEVIKSAVEKLTTPNQQRVLLFITGASGSGKSSFAQAGLIPALEELYQKRHQHVHHAVFRPSKKPLDMFMDALQQLGIPVEKLSSEAIQEKPSRLHKFLAHTTPTDHINLIIIDQFEEAFTQSEPAQRDQLFTILCQLPSFATIRTHIIVTVRADYLPELFAHQDIYNETKRGIDLRVMSEAELKLAIQRPLQQHPHPEAQSKRFEQALLHKLATDAAADATYLPLLQVTLDDLWERGKLMLHAYDKLTDAIRQRAEHVYTHTHNNNTARLQKKQDTIMSLFLGLVDVSQDDDPRRDVRRRRTLDELTNGNAEHKRLVKELADARLLSTGLEHRNGQDVEVVDIIHESLLSNWERLRTAIANERETLQQRARFEMTLQEWQERDQSEEWLLRGIQLSEAEYLAEQGDVALRSPEAQDFFKRSVDKREQERRKRLRTAQLVIAALFVLLLVAVWFGFQSNQNAQTAQAEANARATAEAQALEREQEANAEAQARANAEAQAEQRAREANVQSNLALSRQLAAQSVSNQEQNLDLALLLAVQADTVTSTAESRSSLLMGLQSSPLRTTLREHTGSVNSVAFCTKCERPILASASADNTIRLWDMTTDPPTLLGVLEGHTSSVWSVAFSPDGRTLASGSWDETIRLWDVANPAQATALGEPLRGHTEYVWSVAFSPDGRTLASGSGDDTSRLWEVANPARATALGEPLRGHTEDVVSVAFSPDGRTLASGSVDETSRLWEVANPARATALGEPLRGHTEYVVSVAFSPDGRTLASGSGDDTIRLWDVANPAQATALGEPLRGHTNGVWSVAFSPDGRTLASGSWDDTIRLWDVANPAQATALGEPLRGHTEGVESVAFSPDGETLASGSGDATIRLWDVANPAQATALGEPLHAHTSNVESVAFSPDGRTLASESGVEIRLWDVANPAQATALGEPLRGHTSFVRSVAFSPDGRTLASGSEDDTIRLWDVANPARATALGEPLRGHTEDVLSVAFSPDGRTLASGSVDDTIRLWDMNWQARACRASGRNLAWDEWQRAMGTTTPYTKTCATLPVHASVLAAGDQMARDGQVDAAIAWYEYLNTIDSELGIDPQARAKEIANEQE